jgi:tryptophan-rich sensory protein
MSTSTTEPEKKSSYLYMAISCLTIVIMLIIALWMMYRGNTTWAVILIIASIGWIGYASYQGFQLYMKNQGQ